MKNNRITATILSVALVFAYLSCRKTDTPQTYSETNSAAQPHAASANSNEQFSRTLNLIVACQNAVSANPENWQLVRDLITASFDTSTGCFFVVGKGVENPEHPEAAREQGRKRAASFTAERWSLYLKLWRTGKRIPLGTPLSGKIMYSKVLFEAVADDTLFQLMHIPLGSIVHKGDF